MFNMVYHLQHLVGAFDLLAFHLEEDVHQELVMDFLTFLSN